MFVWSKICLDLKMSLTNFGSFLSVTFIVPCVNLSQSQSFWVGSAVYNKVQLGPEPMYFYYQSQVDWEDLIAAGLGREEIKSVKDSSSRWATRCSSCLLSTEWTDADSSLSLLHLMFQRKSNAWHAPVNENFSNSPKDGARACYKFVSLCHVPHLRKQR